MPASLINNCISRFFAGQLKAFTAAIAKRCLTNANAASLMNCIHRHGNYRKTAEYLIARMWADSRVEIIYASKSEFMKEVVGWLL